MSGKSQNRQIAKVYYVNFLEEKMGKRCQYCNKELDEVLMKCCPDCLLKKTRERERETIRKKNRRVAKMEER